MFYKASLVISQHSIPMQYHTTTARDFFLNNPHNFKQINEKLIKDVLIIT